MSVRQRLAEQESRYSIDSRSASCPRFDVSEGFRRDDSVPMFHDVGESKIAHVTVRVGDVAEEFVSCVVWRELRFEVLEGDLFESRKLEELCEAVDGFGRSRNWEGVTFSSVGQPSRQKKWERRDCSAWTIPGGQSRCSSFRPSRGLRDRLCTSPS